MSQGWNYGTFEVVGGRLAAWRREADGVLLVWLPKEALDSVNRPEFQDEGWAVIRDELPMPLFGKKGLRPADRNDPPFGSVDEMIPPG